MTLLSFSRKVEHGTARFSAAPSKAVSKAMDWSELPDSFKSAQPSGMLAASVAELIPSGAGLEKHALELAVTTVRDFEFVKIQVKKGKTANKAPTFKTELHFAVDFVDTNGARKLEAYMQVAGESTLRVTYEKQAELDLGPDSFDGAPELDDKQRARAAGKDE